MRAMETGALVRVEELTRIPADVQDALITILSREDAAGPRARRGGAGRQGFNVIATANNRDKGVNDLSSALKRRFNTVVLPLPDTLEQEVEIVRTRVAALGASLELPADLASLSEIERVVTVFRELRAGVTPDQRTTIKSPSATLSTAEAISVMTNGLALAAHFGDGIVRADDVAGRPRRRRRQGPRAGPHRVAGVPRDRRARTAASGPTSTAPAASWAEPHADAPSRSSGSATTGPARPGRCAAPSTSCRPTWSSIEGRPSSTRSSTCCGEADMVPPVAGLVYAVDEPRRPTFYPLAVFSPEWVAAAVGARARRPGALRRPAGRPRLRAGQEEAAPPEPAERTTTRTPVDGPPVPAARLDPIGTLAAAAGYDDAERWWEDAVEQRHGSPAERVRRDPRGHGRGPRRPTPGPTTTPTCAATPAARRAMRRVLRAGQGGAERIAVVCGALHAPALVPADFPPAAATPSSVTRLPKTKVAATWAPWTAAGSAASGYGAGVTSPGWYQHLFDHLSLPEPDRATSPRRGWSGSPARCARNSSTPRRRRSWRPPGWPRPWPPCAAGRRSG